MLYILESTITRTEQLTCIQQVEAAKADLVAVQCRSTSILSQDGNWALDHFSTSLFLRRNVIQELLQERTSLVGIYQIISTCFEFLPIHLFKK
jgi:hypothetical protein